MNNTKLNFKPFGKIHLISVVTEAFGTTINTPIAKGFAGSGNIELLKRTETYDNKTKSYPVSSVEGKEEFMKFINGVRESYRTYLYNKGNREVALAKLNVELV